jgi:putative sterol carrier protein
MPDAISAFFAELGTRGHEPLLERATGTFSFEVTGKRPEHWFVEVKKGDIAVSHADTPADCTVRAERRVLDDIMSGRANALAAALRGAVAIEGDISLLATFQRLLPGPPSTTGS